jgi:hypothetical protein
MTDKALCPRCSERSERLFFSVLQDMGAELRAREKEIANGELELKTQMDAFSLREKELCRKEVNIAVASEELATKTNVLLQEKQEVLSREAKLAEERKKMEDSRAKMQAESVRIATENSAIRKNFSEVTIEIATWVSVLLHFVFTQINNQRRELERNCLSQKEQASCLSKREQAFKRSSAQLTEDQQECDKNKSALQAERKKLKQLQALLAAVVPLLFEKANTV